jgi:hypothetical protein
MAPEFNRDKPGFRFEFGGVNIRDVPDALPLNKYCAAQNIRSTGAKAMRTRPGYVNLFALNNGGAGVIDIRAFTALGTDNLPRLLAVDIFGEVFLDTGVDVVNLTAGGNGFSMLPFRPAESPQAWMYVAGQNGNYVKIQAPNANNNCVVYNVGIAEPQQSLDACPQTAIYIHNMTGNAGNWTAGGNASGLADGNRYFATQTYANSFQDPAFANRSYCPTVLNPFAVGELVSMGGGTPVIVEDVLPSFSSSSIAVQSVRYASGNNGNCVMALGNVPLSGNQVGALRRGSVCTLYTSANNNVVTENILVLDAVSGPNGQLCIDTSTVGNYASALPGLLGQPTIAVAGGPYAHNTAINSTIISANLATGIGTISTTFPLVGNPFTSPYPANFSYPQEDDYFHISLAMSDPTKLIQLLILFNLDSGNNYNNDLFYYAVQPSDLVDITGGNNNSTQLDSILQAAEGQIIAGLETGVAAPGYAVAGNNAYSEILFNLSQLTQLGGNQGLTLANVTGMQLQFNVSNNISVQFGSIWIGSGGQPDTGNNGSTYKYQAVPLSSLTGVRGNPTALMRYGVTPKRQSVNVKTSALSAAYDSQIDTWEIYRYGGSVFSYRFLGTAPIGSDFVDNYFDDAVSGDVPQVSIDNTQPWPTLDLPLLIGGSNGFAATLNAYGYQLTTQLTGGNAWPSLIGEWLPGTLFQLGLTQTGGGPLGGEAFTLRYRPTSLGNNTYLFQFEECIGGIAPSSVFVLEPNVAAQPLPYAWGPNEYGDFFSCGGVLRPGVVQWAKPYAPDAAPTKNTLDLCPPSEPLLGGATLGGIDIVASSNRWWALYFQAGNQAQRYQQVEIAVGKRLASPYGKCADGSKLYFWATDCIAVTGGGPAISLTDTDLFTLFPHGGIQGKNVTRGPVTYYAPDYSRASQFRLAVREGLLYALYVDVSNTYRMLIGEIKGDSVAWENDVYAATMTAVYALEQPKGTLTTSPSLYPAVVMGTMNGNVVKLQDLTNDGGNNNGTPISSLVYTAEWDGGDARAQTQWGDQYVDVFAPAGMSVTPVSQGANVANNTTIAANNNRQFVPVSVGGASLVNFIGLQLSWSDNFATQNNYTSIHVWQPSFVDKPEIIKDRYGDWVDFGQASYVRGCIIHANTNGANKNISIRNGDSNTLVQFSGILGNGLINHNGEQEIAYFFNPPFVAHMVRDESQDLIPWQKFGIEWIRDPWPEISQLPSKWFNMGTTAAKFLQGCVIPLDTNGGNANNAGNGGYWGNNSEFGGILWGNNNVGANGVSIQIVSSDGAVITLPPVSTPPAEKTAVPFSFSPIIGHEFQLNPLAPCRYWDDEIVWIWEETPELAAVWITQWTALGSKGYKSIPRIEAAYASTQSVTLTITSYDGQSPVALTLPATGVVMQRVLLTLSFNKGQLYQFQLTSPAPFQVFANDFIVHVYDWGRQGEMRAYNNLGAEFGDKARI